MDNEFTYDPEDLERLLSEKSFSQLLPEEKAFVLQYVDNDLEYDSMRDTLVSLRELTSMEEAISPKTSTKEALMTAFTAKTSANQNEENEKTGVWTWFWNTNKTILYRPGFQLTSLALVLISVFYISTFSPADRTAQAVKKDSSRTKNFPKESKKKEKEPTTKSITQKETYTDDSNSTTAIEIAENSSADIELEVNDISEADENFDIIRDDSKMELEDEKSLPEVEEILLVEEDDSEFKNQDKDSFTETAQTDVILEDISLDETTLIYDAREAAGNMAPTSLNKEKASSAKFANGNNDAVVTSSAAGDMSLNAPLKASNYSDLLGKLYTAQ